eukprot:5354527-Karenia_brevis.AAC.1
MSYALGTGPPIITLTREILHGNSGTLWTAGLDEMASLILLGGPLALERCCWTWPTIRPLLDGCPCRRTALDILVDSQFSV